jgi:hypothetical protein
MTKFQTSRNGLALTAGILTSALLSATALAETTHLVTTDGGFKTTHGLAYTITSDQMTARGPEHRNDQFGENPYEISLGALFSDDGVVMIHAERVANQSGASNYQDLPRSKWPDNSFRFSGATCIDVSAAEIEGEHDLEWLRDNGFEPTGPMVFVQYYATTDDFNDEIVITLLARVDACTPELEPSEKLAPLRNSVVITRAD